MYKGIIIFGTMGAGKDELALALRECIPGAAIYKLGGDIRKPIDKLSLYVPEIDENKRSFYQKYGQGLRELIHKDVWNYMTYDHIEMTKITQFTANTMPVIADGRQMNEFEFWSEKGYLTIGIYASEKIRTSRLLKRDGYVPDESAFTHNTELQAMYIVLNKARISFDNCGNIEDLKKFAKKVSEEIQANLI